MIAFETYEKTPGGDTPYLLLDTSPDGKYLALQAGGRPAGGVWERETRRLIWSPSGAIALAWLRNGMQIAVLREAASSSYELEVYTWPETEFLQRCSVAQPAGWGWMVDLVISPQNDLALCCWVDQTEAGFEFVDMTPDGISHDGQAGYFLHGTNDITRPAFSPNGHFWVFGYKHDEIWWAPDPEDIETYGQPARGGEYSLGALQIFRRKQPLSRTLPLVATLPAGWLPEDPDSEDVLRLGDPIFLDAQQIQIWLPSGEVQLYPVPTD